MTPPPFETFPKIHPFWLLGASLQDKTIYFLKAYHIHFSLDSNFKFGENNIIGGIRIVTGVCALVELGEATRQQRS